MKHCRPVTLHFLKKRDSFSRFGKYFQTQFSQLFLLFVLLIMLHDYPKQEIVFKNDKATLHVI